MASIQFRTADDTIKAFDAVKCQVWSLWDGKRFMFKGTGSEELQSFLDLMTENGASNAVYSLAYYEGAETAKTINSKTPFDGSFNFRLNADEMELNTGEYKSYLRQQAQVTRLSGLENKVDLLLERLDGGGADQESKKNNLGVIGDLLEHPALAPVLPVLVQKILDAFIKPGNPAPLYPLQGGGGYPVPAKVSGIDQQPTATAPGDYYQSAQIDRAIEKLLRVDTKLADHLEKLVWLAENNRPTFDYIMSQLEQMKTE